MKLSISMTRKETLLGWIYLLLNLFVLPLALVLVNQFLPHPLSETEINLVFMGMNFLAIALIFRRFLTASVKSAVNKPWRVLGFAGLGFVLYFLFAMVIGAIILQLAPDFSNVNDDTIIGLFDEHPALMAITTVLLVPVTEEVLYRGLLFQGLQRKNRVLAYTVSVLVFAGIHIVGYVGSYDLKTLLLCFLQYLPAGTMLAWAYEKSDTIVTPILMHTVINLIGTSVTR